MSGLSVRLSSPIVSVKRKNFRSQIEQNVAEIVRRVARKQRGYQSPMKASMDVDLTHNNDQTVPLQEPQQPAQMPQQQYFSHLLEAQPRHHPFLSLGGHRGLGANVWTSTGAMTTKSATFRENTIASFMAAVNAGATFIEFDVQITKDDVAVLFHDNYVVYGQNTASPTSSLVKDLSLADFKSLAPAASPGTSVYGGSEADDELAGFSEEEEEATSGRTQNPTLNPSGDGGAFLASKNHQRNMSSMSLASKASNSSSNTALNRLMRQKHNDRPANPCEPTLGFWNVAKEDEFPTLSEVFQAIPTDIAFDIEVKMTTPSDVERTPIEEIHRVVTATLNAVELATSAHNTNTGSNRTVMFSSFDPDICTEIKQRRPHYPVMFLTEAGANPHADKRRTSFAAAIDFAVSNNLQGIICDTTMLHSQPEAVLTATGRGLLVLSYGLQNDDHGWVLKQQALGVHGVIVDDVVGVSKALATLLV